MGRTCRRPPHGHGEPDLPADRGGGRGLSRSRRPARLPGLVDAHCHLQHERFDADRDAVVARAVEAGIERILVPGWDLPSSEAALALAERHGPTVQAAVGVHPHHAAELDEPAWARIEELAADPRCVAVGEIGLDHYRLLAPRELQAAVFARQLDLATRLGRPVVVHDRDAHEEVTRALLGWTGRAMLHAFSGDAAMARGLAAAGHLVSFALPVAFRSAAGPRQAAREVAAGSYLVETDAPYLGPDRDTRNEPTTALRVAAELARIRAQTPETVAGDARAAYDRWLAR